MSLNKCLESTERGDEEFEKCKMNNNFISLHQTAINNENSSNFFISDRNYLSNTQDLNDGFSRNFFDSNSNNDFSCPSLYFEAIDLCLPSNSISNHHHHNHHYNHYNTSSIFGSPISLSSNQNNGFNNESKFYNQNHNPDNFPRSNSVPIGKFSFSNSKSDLEINDCFINKNIENTNQFINTEFVYSENQKNGDINEIGLSLLNTESNPVIDKYSAIIAINPNEINEKNEGKESKKLEDSTDHFSSDDDIKKTTDISNSVKSDINKVLMMKLKDKAKQKLEMNDIFLSEGFNLVNKK